MIETNKHVGYAYFLVMIIKPIVDLFWDAPLLFGKLKVIWIPYAIFMVCITIYALRTYKIKKKETIFAIVLGISIIIGFFLKKIDSLEIHVRMLASFSLIIFYDEITNNITKKDVIIFLKLYLWALALPCFIGVFQALGFYPQPLKYFATGGYSMQNAFIAYLYPAFFATVYLAFEEKNEKYLVYSLVTLFYLSAVNMMVTRLSIVITVFTLVACYVLKDKLKLNKITTYIFTIPVVVAFIGAVVYFDINLSDRNWVWMQYVDYFINEATILDILLGRSGIPREMPHNNYLGIFVIYGIFAVALYFQLVRKRLKNCINQINRNAEKSKQWLYNAILISSTIAWYTNALMVTTSYYMMMTWTNMMWIIIITILTKPKNIDS